MVTNPRLRLSFVVLSLTAILVIATPARLRTAAAQAGGCANAVVCENLLPGSPPSEWDLVNDPVNPDSHLSDPAIQGFAASISVNKGETVQFKVNTAGLESPFTIDVYRLGYYGGMGARHIVKITPTEAEVTAANNQQDCVGDATGVIDCGNWSVTGSWAVPTDAASGIYIAKLTRADSGGASHLVFVVRDDARPADLLFQTSDTTWQAYNRYGGKSLYYDAASSPTNNNINPPEYQTQSAGRAYKVSYNRPFDTRDHDPQSFVFNAEYPMVRFLEANGYDVKYWTGVDTDRFGAALVGGAAKPKAFLSVGHDEYWSAGQRSNVEAARNAGVNLAFFSGNEMFWKTRWEPSILGAADTYKTLVSYKETFHATVPASALDPNPTVWTGTWRDRNGASSGASDGNRPENGVTGTLFTVNSGTAAIQVPAEYRGFRLWRGTSVATAAPGSLVTLAPDTVGYEWDEDIDNGRRPAGLARLSLTTVDGVETLVDSGATFVRNTTATHALTMYRHPSGALVFGAGTVQWSWGLDGNHDRRPNPAIDPNLTTDVSMRQATVNLFADMGVTAGLLQSGLIAATGSTDTTPPTSAIVDPLAGATLQAGVRVSIAGTATDVGGFVTAVEVSVDGGATWHRARGLANWSYDWSPTTSGAVTLLSRAIDDSGNAETPGAGVLVNVAGSVCPCQSLWNPATTTPGAADSGDGAAVEVGVKFFSDGPGFISGLRFYKSELNAGPHVVSLWTSGGALLASAASSGESTSGWQEVQFASPVQINAGTTYVASYHAGSGHYAVSQEYFGTTGIDSPPLHAPSGANGVFTYASTSAFPTSSFRSSNYWVDVIFSSSGQIPPSPNLAPPVISSVRAAALDHATAVIRWSTNEPATSQVQYSTDPGLPPDATSSSTIDTNLVTSHSVVLSGLTANATYYYRVLSANRSGIVATFASAPSVTVPGPTLHDSAAVDFSNGTIGSATYVAQTDDGEVILKPTEGAEFFGSALPPGWKGIAWANGGSAIVGGGNLVVDGMRVGTCTTNTTGVCTESSPYGPGRSLEFVATFAGDAFQHAGFGVDLDQVNRWAIFSTGRGATVLARTNVDGLPVEAVTDLGPSYLDGRPHRYRIDWNPTSVDYFIDGVGVATHQVAIADGMRPIAASDLSLLPGKVVVDWIRMAPYTAAGDFISRVFDATIPNEVWNSLTWVASTPGVSLSVRASNTAFADANPTDPAWQPVAAPGALTGVTGQYVQYKAHLSSANANQTPELDEVVVSTDRTPVARPDHASTQPGIPYTFPASGPSSLKANDVDDDNTNDQLHVSAVTASAHGLVDLNDDGSVTYTPAPDFIGDDTFIYTISDGLLTSTATVTMTVAVNSPPVAIDDTFTIAEDTVLTVAAPGVLGNDTDVDVSDTRTAVLVAGSGPANGSLTLNADGSFTYTPTANFNGTDSFKYQAKDAAGALSNVATVTITVKAVNDAPVAADDAYTTNEDTVLTIAAPGVLGNDTDVDVSDTRTAVLVAASGPANGSVTLSADGSFVYTPSLNFNGTDSFKYQAKDAAGALSNVATVTITVNAVNDAPVATNDAYTTNEDTVLTIAAPGVLGNDTDVDVSDTRTAVLVAASGPANGTLTLSADGSFVYTPSLNFNGTDSFKYQAKDAAGALSNIATVTITVKAVNDVPVAANDAYTTNEDTVLTIAAPGVLGNDTDVDVADTRTAVLVAASGPANGSLTLSADGSFVYTPSLNFNGTDSFKYQAKDAAGALSNVATVTITVKAVNDAPVAANDAYTTNEDTALTIAAPGVLGNDTDVDAGDTRTAVLVPTTVPPHGAVTLNADGSFTYTPSLNFNGTDSFRYQAKDAAGALSNVATVTITVKAVNDAPVAANDAYTTNEDTVLTIAAPGVLGNDTDVDVADTRTAVLVAASGPANGSLTLSADGSFVYTPSLNFNGTDSFKYQAKDAAGALSNIATVTITVKAVNDAPVAANDAYTTNEDTVLTIAAPGVLGNDTDVDVGDTRTAVLVAASGPANGTLTLSADGSFVYTPSLNFNGTDSFKYQAKDAAGALSNIATVTITVNAVNDAPVAANDAYATNEDTVLTIAAPGVLGNDTDVDVADTRTAVLVAASGPANGSVTLNADGSFTYTPTLNFNGTDSFKYQAKDAAGALSNIATVTITVNAVNDLPTITHIVNQTVNEDTPTAPLAFTIGDVETAAAALTVTAASSNLTLVPAANIVLGGAAASRTVTVTPAANQSGTATVTLTVKDADGGTASDSFLLTVNAVNDPPVAANDAYTTNEDTALTIAAPGVLGNDTDVDVADTRTAVLVAASGPANGSVALNADGSFTYTPSANFNGTDSFKYQAKDAAGALSNIATVTITVNAVNDAPVAIAQSVTTAEDTAAAITLAASDVDGNLLTYTVTAGPAHGTLTGTAPALTYMPAPNYNGADSFTFKANDGTTDSNTATVSITVTPVNDAPIAASDTYGVSQGATLTVAAPGVLGNDSDVEGSSLTAILVTTAAKGTLALNANGGFTYTPQATATGTDSFTYKANDGLLDSAPVTVTITIAVPPAPPPAPTVGAIGWNVVVEPVKVGTAIVGTASVANAQSATWSWGDGTTSAGVISGSSVSGTKTYAATGLYTVTLTVTGANNTSAKSVYQYVAVIDPLAGSETGLGSITSPAGSYTANTTLGGTATISSFTAKYGADGTLGALSNTFRFTYSAAGFSFSSLSMKWLVMSGNKSWLKGEGSASGVADPCYYLVSVVDGTTTLDKVRVKIWNKVTGKVIYDNQKDSIGASAPDDALAVQSSTSPSTIVFK